MISTFGISNTFHPSEEQIMYVFDGDDSTVSSRFN